MWCTRRGPAVRVALIIAEANFMAMRLCSNFLIGRGEFLKFNIDGSMGHKCLPDYTSSDTKA